MGHGPNLKKSAWTLNQSLVVLTTLTYVHVKCSCFWEVWFELVIWCFKSGRRCGWDWLAIGRSCVSAEPRYCGSAPRYLHHRLWRHSCTTGGTSIFIFCLWQLRSATWHIPLITIINTFCDLCQSIPRCWFRLDKTAFFTLIRQCSWTTIPPQTTAGRYQPMLTSLFVSEMRQTQRFDPYVLTRWADRSLHVWYNPDLDTQRLYTTINIIQLVCRRCPPFSCANR